MEDYLKDAEKYSDLIVEWLIEVVPSVLLAIVILIVGWMIAGFVRKTLRAGLSKAGFDQSLIPFLSGIVVNLFKVLVVVSAAGVIGIETTSFIAVLGAAGLAVGMALQGSLGNFAGGVLLLIFKPIKSGEYIEAQGHGGTVSEVQIFCTVLLTPDNKTIILPNGALAGGSIVNYSRQDTRRVDMTFGIGYDDDIAKAKSILSELVNNHEGVLKTPEPVIEVVSHGDSSVNIVCRPWVKKEDYWRVHFDMHEQVKLEFDKQGVSIPFPQRDVHIHNADKVN